MVPEDAIILILKAHFNVQKAKAYIITQFTSLNYRFLRNLIGPPGVLFPKVGIIIINKVVFRKSTKNLDIKSRLLDNLNWQSLACYDPKSRVNK